MSDRKKRTRRGCSPTRYVLRQKGAAVASRVDQVPGANAEADPRAGLGAWAGSFRSSLPRCVLGAFPLGNPVQVCKCICSPVQVVCNFMQAARNQVAALRHSGAERVGYADSARRLNPHQQQV